MAIELNPLNLFSSNIDEVERVTEQDAVTLVNNEYKRRLEERRPFELQWRLNMAFVEGNHFVDINPAGMDILDVPLMYEWQEREPFNHIGPIIETRIARLSRMRPVLRLRPGTNEPEDIRSAKVGSHLLRNIYYDHGVKASFPEFFAWLEVTGNCFFKNVWDTSKGPLISPGAVGFGMEQTEEYTSGYHGSELREGDLDVVMVPSQEFFPDSCYKSGIEQLRSAIHARVYNVDDVEDIWGVRPTTEDAVATRLQRSMVGFGGLGYGMGGFTFQVGKLEDSCIVKEYWEVPSRKRSRGRLIIVAGQKLIHYGPLPFPVGKEHKLALPFAKASCIKRPGVFWDKTVVERLIPLQRRYNAIKNRKAEYLNRASIGSYFAERGSTDIDDMEQNAGSPGYICIVERGYKYPQPMQNQALPAEFSQEEAAILQEFNSLSGVSDISRQSKAPPGVKSGVAISLALEQDDTRLSSVAGNIENFLVENGKQWLRLYKNYAMASRILRMIGENNIVDVVDWTGADIRSDDVIIEAMSAIVESPAARRQMVFDLLNAGLLQDPETGNIDKEARSQVFEMIELGHWETGAQEEQIHTSKAERENLTMRNGQQTVAVAYDDHILHISRHNKYRLSAEYEALVRDNPQIDEMFQQHTDMHIEYLMPALEEQDGHGGQGGQGSPSADPGEGMPYTPAQTPGAGFPVPGADILPNERRDYPAGGELL